MQIQRSHNKVVPAWLGAAFLATFILVAVTPKASASNAMLGVIAGAAAGYAVGSNQTKPNTCTEKIAISYEDGQAVTLKTLILENNQWRLGTAEGQGEAIFLCPGRYRSGTNCRMPVEGFMASLTGKTEKFEELNLEEGLAALVGPNADLHSLSTCESPTGTGLALTYQVMQNKE